MAARALHPAVADVAELPSRERPTEDGVATQALRPHPVLAR
jgi:hypothetical protein